MKIEQKNLPESRRQFTVTLDQEEVGEQFARAVTQLATAVKIQGFRPGRAPAELVRQNLDETKLREEAYSQAVRATWQAISDQLSASSQNAGAESRPVSSEVEGEPPAESWHEAPIQDPEVSLDKFEEGEEARVVFEFDIRPQVKIGAWRQVRIKNLESRIKNKASEKEVDELIDSLRTAHAKTVAKLTPAKMGDKVHVNFEGAVGGVRQDKLSSKNFPLILGHSNTIPGFDTQLVDLKKGDKKTFRLDFPADHFDKSLVGQAVDFDTEIEEVFDIILPELNQEFAEKFGHKSVQRLNKAISLDIGRRKTEEQFVTRKARWLAEFEHLVQCELPESLLKAEVERSREAWRKFLQERHINEGDWLKSRQTTLEQLEKDWHKAAESSVKIGLGLAEVAKEQRKELKSNEEFQALLDELVKKSIDSK